MTDNTSNPNPDSQPGENDPNNQPPTPPKPKKKKRLVLKIILGLVILILLLVLLAPTILSMGFVRDIVVSKINSSALNGKLDIKDWSFGWTSGVHIEGVELSDPNNSHLLSVASVDVPISLIKAATGNLDLGDVTIKGVDFNAVIDSNGQLNFLSALKPSNTPPSTSPSKLPNVKGTVHIENVTGTIEDDAAHLPVISLPQQSPLNVTVAIKDINQPIDDTIDLGIQIAQKDLIKIKVDGSVAAISNNLVDIDKLNANQTIELSQGDLAAVSQVLQAMHMDLNVTGKMDGKITATVSTLDNISAGADITLASASAGGKMLHGDTVALQSGNVKLNAAITSTGGANRHITLDLPVVLQTAGSANANHINVHADVAQDSLTGFAGDLQAISAHLMKSSGPGTQSISIPGQGVIKITADFDVPAWLNQVPHLVPLESGTSLTSGTFAHETTINIAQNQAVIATDTTLKNFAGSTGGQPIHVGDIDATAGLTAVAGNHPDLHDVKIGMTSAFATVTGGGPGLGKLNVSGKSDLKDLQQQFNFINFDEMFHAPPGSHVSLAGTLSFEAHTDGDLTGDQSNIATGASFSATSLAVNIPGKRPINEPKLTASISSNLHHTAAQFVDAANDLNLSLQSPAINFAAGGSAKIGGRFGVEIPSFKITQGTIDPRLAQEEFGGALSLFVPRPDPSLPPTLMQKIADNSVRVASGSINISGEFKLDSTGFGFPQPLKIQAQPIDLAVADEMGTVQTAHLPAFSTEISGNGAVDSQNVASVKDLTLSVVMGSSDSPLFNLGLAIDANIPMSAAADAPAMTIPRIELTHLDGNLPGLQTALGPVLPLLVPLPAAGATTQPSPLQLVAQNVLVCSSGTLSGSMLAASDGKTISFQKPLAVTLANLTVQQRGGSNSSNVINDETIHLTVSATADADGSAVRDLNVALNTSLAKTISITNGQFVLATHQDNKLVPAGTFAMLNSVHVDVSDVDLVKGDAVINGLFNQAATPAPGETAVVIVPPPQVTSGVANFSMDITRSGDVTTANITQAVIHGLAVKSGDNTTTWPNDITAKFSAQLNSSSDARQLLSAAINSLTVDTGVGTTLGLADNKPIVAQSINEPASMSVQGGVHIVGDIAPLARVAETFTGAKPNTYADSGHFDFNESLSKTASDPRLHISGGGSVTKFVVMSQPGQSGAAAPVLFSEDNLSIQNPLQFDLGTFSVIIDQANPIAVAFNSSNAAGFSLTGTINDVALKRQIATDNPINVNLSYDLAKLWPIVKPLLSPSSQQTLADLVITGKQTRVIKVTGSLPADKAFNDSVAMLVASGFLTVDHLSTQGITIDNFEFPFVLRNGILRTVYAGIAEGSNFPHPATCNGGAINIGVMRLDVRTMLLSMPYVNNGKPVDILKGVSLNPAMSKSVVGKLLNNPAFVNANQAQGLLSLQIQHLDKLPLGGLLTQVTPQNQGTAQLTYSIQGLRLGSELLAVFGNDSVAADINNASVKYAGGMVTEDTTMMIDSTKPLRFAGGINLQTEQFSPSMMVYIPSALFDRLIPQQDWQYVPDSVVVPLKGDMTHPKLDLGQAIAQTVQDAAKKAAKNAIINGLLNGLQHAH